MPFAATTPPRLLTLIFMTALAVLSLNMFVASLPNMAADFGVDYATVSLTLGAYLALTTVFQLFAGPMSDRFGRRPVVLAGLGVFTAASIGCVLAQDFWVFLGFRLMQGVVISGWIIALAAIRDTAPPGQASSRLGYLSMAMALAPMLGPMVGGFVDEAFGWRANFALFAVLGALLWLIVWCDLGETNTDPSPTILAQFQSYPELFGSRRFWGYAITSVFSIGAFYTFIAGAPKVASTWLDLNASELGIGVGIITAGFMAGSFVSGRFGPRFELTTMMMAGRLSGALGLTVGLVFFAFGEVTIFTLFGCAILVGFGNGLTIPNANAGVISVRPNLAGSAAGMSGALTVANGALVTSLIAALLTPANGPFVLFGMMLVCVLIGLGATLYVMAVNRAEART